MSQAQTVLGPFVANKWVSSSISKPFLIKDSSSPNAQETP